MKHLIICVSFILLASCETVVEVPIPMDPPKLVINGTISPESYIHVNLSQSKNILDATEYKYVSNAKIELYQNDQLLEVLPDSSNGDYISATYKPTPGNKYKIVAAASGFDLASAEVIIPFDSIIILNATVDSVEEHQFGHSYLSPRINVEIKDNDAIANYYSISVVSEYYQYEYEPSPDSSPVLVDSTFTTANSFISSGDPSIEDYNSSGSELLFSDDLFNGRSYVISIILNDQYWIDQDYPHSSKPVYKLLVKNTSESYYKYNSTAALQRWTYGNPFAQPVQVYSNVIDGYGILDAYNTFSYKLEW